MENRKIDDARLGLAKLANAELPAPVVLLLAPTLDACARVLDDIRLMRESVDSGEYGAEKLEAFLGEESEIPAARIPALPEIRLTYIDLDNLRGIVEMEVI